MKVERACVVRFFISSQAFKFGFAASSMTVYPLLRLLLTYMINPQFNKFTIPLLLILHINNRYAVIREICSTARHAITHLREMIMLMLNICAHREIQEHQPLMLVTSPK
jgi:hypothetical protein